VKVAAPSTGITRFTKGSESGIAMSTPAAQIVRRCFLRN
jgi:hypothetical protein